MINRPINIGHAYYRIYLRMRHQVDCISDNLAVNRSRMSLAMLARLDEKMVRYHRLAKLAWHRMTQREAMGLDSER